MSAEPDQAREPSLLLTGGSVLLPSGPTRADLTVRGGRVITIDQHADTTPRSNARIDTSGLMAAPGLIDLQINGGYGHDIWSDPSSLWSLAQLLPRHGVTAFCPTIISGPPDRAIQAIEALSDRPETSSETPAGAEPLGLHLEGPILAPTRIGAHDRRHLVAADTGVAAAWTRSNGVRLVTLAPELPGAIDLIRRLRAEDVVVSAGHSDASAEETARAVEAGLSLVTHLFNAMAPLHHRRPGLAGHTLGSDGLAAGLIADGIHLAPEIVNLAFRALGPDRLVLVSDAVAAMGLPADTHRLGGRTVRSSVEGVRRPDGTLAGSNLSLDQAVRNLIAFTGCRPAQALACASANPARIIGEPRRGRLVSGATADIVLLDEDLQVVATMCRGRLAHLEPGAANRLSGIEPPPPMLV